MTSTRPRHVLSNNNPTKITTTGAPKMQNSLLSHSSNNPQHLKSGRVPLQSLQKRNEQRARKVSSLAKRVKVVEKEAEQETTKAVETKNATHYFYEDQALSKIPENVSDVDENCVVEACGMDCVRDNFFYLLYLDELHQLSPEYPHCPPDNKNKPTLVTDRMRVTLLDWAITCCEKLQLRPQTTYLGIWILDQFLDRCNSPSRQQARTKTDFQPPLVDKTNLQLVGITAFVIASKYEECSFPTLDDWVFLCADSASEKDIMAMELQILQTLDFTLNAPQPIQFLRRFGKIIKVDQELYTVAKFFLESCSYSSSLVKVPGHVRALACLHIAACLKGKSIWSKELEYYSQLNRQAIQGVIGQVSRHMIKTVADVHNRKQQKCKAIAVFKRYSREENYMVALKPEVVACVVRGSQDLPRHERMTDSHIKVLPGKVVTIRVNPILEKLSK